MQRIFFFCFLLLTTVSVAAKDKKPVLKGKLFRTSKFRFNKKLSDEFKGKFDDDKWFGINPRWKGRQPGLFAAKNVKQKNGKLILRGKYEKAGSSAFDDAPEGYENFTTSFVMTKKKIRYGYFEVKAKPSNSRLSSSFWGSLDTPKRWTEIDVFEIGGGAINEADIDFRKRINTNLHVFRDEKRGIERGENEIHKPFYHTHNKYLRSGFNVYGLDWGKKWITWTFNGREIRKEKNKYWKQAFPMKFDVETMPYWFGLPSKRTLPAYYKIKYFRMWSRKRKGKKSKDSNRNALLDLAKVPKYSSTDRTRFLSTGPFDIFNSIPTGSIQHEGDNHVTNGPLIDEINETEEVGGENQVENIDSDLPNDDIDDDEDDEDEAETEIVEEHEEETEVPNFVLQRAPIPGSNERIYEPVLPPIGTTWSELISKQNSVMNDVLGIEIQPEENINAIDFEDEIILFAK